jgi:hypothetical protein
MAEPIWTGRKNARESLRVSRQTFKGVELVDIRVVVPLTATAPDCLTPTAKGVSFQPHLLPAVIAALQEAERQARAEGLLDGVS